MAKKYLLGIDLHGTLLDDQWEIKHYYQEDLVAALKTIKEFCKVFVCSGNDLTFTRKHIPYPIRRHFDGLILETGCVISNGRDEKVVVRKSTVKAVKELERMLKKKKLPQVKYFARRLATISMFTRDPSGGIDPAKIHPRVVNLVKEYGFGEQFQIIPTDVAVDIIPNGHNKFTGMKRVSGRLRTIGIADSRNDFQMILDTDFAFLPANSSRDLINRIQEEGMRLSTLDRFDLLKKQKHIAFKSELKSTNAVLKFLKVISASLEKS
jgi:hydroxymethylpyrimidine pyrophosphatase-like HAD family hydrolase